MTGSDILKGALHNVRARRGRTGCGGAMASKSTKEAPVASPEFAVRRETISAYFHPPLPSSTFHDFVTEGKIIPMWSMNVARASAAKVPVGLGFSA